MSNRTSTKPVAGAPNPAAVDMLSKQVQATKGTGQEVYFRDADGNFPSNTFPVTPYDYDKYDTMRQVKDDIIAKPNYTAFVPFTDADAAYELRKRDQMENADYDRWINQKFDVKDPSQLRMFQEIAPEQFKRREDLIKYKQSLTTRMANIRLYGPRSEDDLKFEWLVETGRIRLPESPVWHGAGQMQNLDASNEAAYKKGIFNPLKFITDANMGRRQDTTNYSDVYSDQTKAHLGGYAPIKANGTTTSNYGRSTTVGYFPSTHVNNGNNIVGFQ